MLTQIESLAKQLMHRHGLIEQGWKFDWNKRKSSFGLCDSRNRMIYLSAPLTPLRKIENIENTIKHEIAHALVGCEHGHNYIWKRKSRELGCIIGQSQNESVDVSNIAKYRATCPNCKHTIYSNGKVRRRSSCIKCSPRYDERFLHVWVSNI